jgi:hypothetical protein
MCKLTDLTHKLVINYVNKHKQFSLKDIEKYVFNNGGIARLGPNYTIKDYLQNLMIRDNLDYNCVTRKYSHNKNKF